MIKYYFTKIDTPLGSMFSCSSDLGVCLLEFPERKKIDSQFQSLHKYFKCDFEDNETPILVNLKNELSEYFAGKRQIFTVPLHFVGTDFQKKVWHELVRIPFGKTVSYKELAEKTGNVHAVRAVANANAFNKISIIVPCHRVIGSDGSLTGYASGLQKKRWLIDHEKNNYEAALFS